MIRINRTTEPPSVLAEEGKRRRAELEARFESGEREFTFDRKVYGHEAVKQQLIAAQHKKCAFCESKVTHVEAGDVEHFRPKAGFRRAIGAPLESPGYYWLAYEWDNLLFSCSECNRRNKGNLFPLADEMSRARNHHSDIAAEAPLFIDPVRENPEAFIEFRKQTPFPISDNERGRLTIEALGLQRPDLAERRLSRFQELKVLWEFIQAARPYTDDPALQEQVEQAHRTIAEAQQPGAEYAAMVRAAVAAEFKLTI